MDYYNKYLKYKTKYLQIGGSLDEFKNIIDNLGNNNNDIQIHIISNKHKLFINNTEIIEKLNTIYDLNNYFFIDNEFELLLICKLNPNINIIWNIYKNILENNLIDVNYHFIEYLKKKNREFNDNSKLVEYKIEDDIEYDIEDDIEQSFVFNYKDYKYTYIDNIIFSDNTIDITDDNTVYKIWFNLFSLQDKQFKIFNLLLESEKIHKMNLNSWIDFKFFQDGPPYNIIIYLKSDVDLNSNQFHEIINSIFQNFNIDEINIGHSIEHSPIIFTINKDIFEKEEKEFVKQELIYKMNSFISHGGK
jgi:hypothetical protein